MLKPLTLQSQSLLTSQQTVESSSTDRNTRPPYLPPERQKGMTEGEMVGWHHQLNGDEFEQDLGDDEGQGILEYSCSWVCKELDMIE